MEVNSIKQPLFIPKDGGNGKKDIKETEREKGNAYAVEDKYVKGENTVKAGYDKPTPAKAANLSDVLDEAEKAYYTLKQLVAKLLKSQGNTGKQIENGSIAVDEKTQREAQELIAPGGDWSAEKVSDRIVNFAKAISEGDKSKLEQIKQAIEKGFSEAKASLGGWLPDVCQETYSQVQEKLDKWENE